MRRLMLGVMLTCVALSAEASDDDSIFGTHSVVFEPGQSSGILHSCTLVYRAVHPDYAYRNGNPAIIVGSIGVRYFGAKSRMILTLKIGVKDISIPNAPFIRPYFAYLQTPNAATAKSTHKSMNGDEGFRLIAIELNETTTNLVMEMLEANKVTIGFNRKKDGLDVLVPIDLTVFDAEVSDAGKVVRKRSNEATTQFLGCFKKILEQAIQDVPKQRK